MAGVLVAGLLLLAAGWLWFDNPTIDVAATDYDMSGPAGEVQCPVAPWDAGRNGNRQEPGGEHRAPYSEEVATECYVANIDRYHASIVTGSVGAVLLVAASVLPVALRRPRGTVGPRS